MRQGSVVCPVQALNHQVAVEGAHTGTGNPQPHQGSDQPRIPLEDGRAVAARPAGEPEPGPVGPLHKHLLHRAHERLVAADRVLAEHVQEHPVALLLHPCGHLAVHGGRGGSCAHRILEDVGHVVVHRLEEGPGLLEIHVGFPREAHDDVRRKVDAGPCRPERADDLQVALAGVRAVHRPKDAVAARLHGKMDEAAKLGQASVGGDEVGLEAPRMGGSEADALDAVDLMDALEQPDEGRCSVGRPGAAGSWSRARSW